MIKINEKRKDKKEKKPKEKKAKKLSKSISKSKRRRESKKKSKSSTLPDSTPTTVISPRTVLTEPETKEKVLENVRNSWVRPWPKIIAQMSKDVTRYVHKISLYVHRDIYQEMPNVGDSLVDMNNASALPDENNIINEIASSNDNIESASTITDHPSEEIKSDITSNSSEDNSENHNIWDLGEEYICLFGDRSIPTYGRINPIEELFKLFNLICFYVEGNDPAFVQLLNEQKSQYDPSTNDTIIYMNCVFTAIGSERRTNRLFRTCTQGFFAPCSVAMMFGMTMEDLMNNVDHDILFKIDRDSITVIHKRYEVAQWGNISWELVTETDMETCDQLRRVSFNVNKVKLYKGVREQKKELVLKTLKMYAEDNAIEYDV